MEHVAEEVAVVQLQLELLLDVRRQRLEPLPLVPGEGDVHRHHPPETLAVDRVEATEGGTRHESMQHRTLRLLGRAFEEVAVLGSEEFLEVRSRLLHAVIGHFDDPVVFEAIAVRLHPAGQVVRPAMAQELHQQVGELLGQEPGPAGDPIGESTERKELGDEVRSEPIDDQKGVLAVLLGGVVALPVDVLAGHGQIAEGREHVAADPPEHVRVVASDVEDLLFAGDREGVQPDREDRELPGAPGRLVQPPAVGVVAGGLVGFDVANPFVVLVVRGELVREFDVALRVVAFLEVAENLLG